MSEKTKAGISLALTSAAYAALAVDKFTAVDLSDPISIALLIVGSVAAAFGISFTNPGRR